MPSTLPAAVFDKLESVDGLVPVVEDIARHRRRPVCAEGQRHPKWWLVFDLKASGSDPVELRAYLKDPRAGADRDLAVSALSERRSE